MKIILDVQEIDGVSANEARDLVAHLLRSGHSAAGESRRLLRQEGGSAESLSLVEKLISLQVSAILVET